MEGLCSRNHFYKTSLIRTDFVFFFFFLVFKLILGTHLFHRYQVIYECTDGINSISVRIITFGPYSNPRGNSMDARESPNHPYC